MMIIKRLIGTVSESKKYIAGNVIFQWCSLVSNIVMMMAITSLLGALATGQIEAKRLTGTAVVVGIAVIVRFICTIMASKMSFLASRTVKKTLRKMIYEKLLRLGSAYREKVQTSECGMCYETYVFLADVHSHLCGDSGSIFGDK